MDTPPESEFDNLTRLAAAICKTPMACISLLDDRRQWFKSHFGTDVSETPLEVAFCLHSLGKDDVFVVEDATVDPRFEENELVTGGMRIRFYAGAPLITEGGIPVGTICVFDHTARTLTDEEERALRFLAQQTMTLLERRRNLLSAREKRDDSALAERRQRSMRVLDAVSEIANSASAARTMLEQALYAICSEMGWSIGHAWVPDPQLKGQGGPMHLWRADCESLMASYRAMIMADEDACFSGPMGHAMKSRAVATLPASHWEPAQLDNRPLREQGIVWGVALPVIGKEPWGAMEFFGAESAPPDADCCEILAQSGRILGRGLERQRSLTALKLSEAYFRHLTEEALDLVTVLDAQGIIRFESRSLAMELGWTPSEVLGRSAFDFAHPDDRSDVLAAFAESLRTEGPTALLCFRFLHKDGSYRMLEGRGNNLLADPAVAGIVFSSRDISEKKRLEQQFGQLAGGIAHDFNNLLTVIVGYSGVAEAHSQADDKLKNAVSEIRRASDRVAGLTSQLLALTGRQVLQPRVFELDTMLHESAKGLGILLENGISLSLRPGAPGARVHADLAQWDLVLRHLALNANDAMAHGGEVHIETGMLRVRSRTDAASHGVPRGDYALLTFRDTGCGMQQEVRARALEPYFTTKAHGKGTGLGLATCQGILRQSGGRIALESEAGSGTTVTLYLPLVNAAVTDCCAPPPMNMAFEKPPTILFAEDEEVLRELGASVLKDLGYHVLAAENGRAAMELLDAAPGLHIDLLLTDIIMPEMDGKALAAAIRERNLSTPILFCSGYAQDPSFYQGLPKGSAFLSKPYTVSVLAENVCKLIGSRAPV